MKLNKIDVLPQYIYKFQCSDEIASNSLDWIRNNIEYRPNTHNQTSINNRIHKEKPLSDLNKFFKECLIELKRERKIECDEIAITQSWINKTQGGAGHHWHNHPNSFLSAIFYLNDSNANTIFAIGDMWNSRKNFTGNLDLNTRNTEIGAHILHEEPSKAGKLIIFPSVLDHSVSILNQEDDDRFSISFNTFPSGVIGSILGLAGMKIEVK